MKILYQAIFTDEYSNMYELGWYETLEEVTAVVNQNIQVCYREDLELKNLDVKKVQIDRNRVIPQAGTFEPHIDYYVSDLFEGILDEEEACDIFQGARLTVLMHQFRDEEYEMAKTLFCNGGKNEDFEIERFDINTFIELIKKGKNGQILRLLEENKEARFGELLDSIISYTFDNLVNEETKSREPKKINFEAYGIESAKAISSEYLNELMENYDWKNPIERYQIYGSDDIDLIRFTTTQLDAIKAKMKEKEAEKANMEFLGLFINNDPKVQNYICDLYGKDDKLNIYSYRLDKGKKILIMFDSYQLKKENCS